MIESDIVSGDNQSAEARKPLAKPLVVAVRRDGNPAVNEPVQFFLTDGGGGIGETLEHLGDDLRTITGQDGRASLPVWVLGTDGRQRVVARIGDPVETTVPFTATVRPVLRIVSGDKQVAGANEPVKAALV